MPGRHLFFKAVLRRPAAGMASCIAEAPAARRSRTPTHRTAMKPTNRFRTRLSDEKLNQERARAVKQALAEDVGEGDVTAALVPAETMVSAAVIVREAAVLCGTDWFDRVFAELDADIVVTWQVADGDHLQPDQRICQVQGPARPILTGERTALNFLQTLSGTATAAAAYVARVAGTDCRILDTRKTIPGLRLAQKYATRTGGAVNHRIGLYDAILIKENHIGSAGGIAAAIRHARAAAPAMPVEIEVENLGDLRAALDAGVERVLLDNFSLEDLHEAVRINRAHAEYAELEASGGVEGDRVREIAETGVDFISVGALTKHLRAVDLSMRFEFR
jgi:nicotinate-nucleotide pyrophosphorylase (carboxylating)